MALPLLKIRSANGKIRTGTTRLFLIAASECAFLLWKARCKRLLDDDEESRNRIPVPQEIRNRMIATLNDRLGRDCILTSWKRHQSQALPGNLRNKPSLPENWLKVNGALVGIANRLVGSRTA